MPELIVESPNISAKDLENDSFKASLTDNSMSKKIKDLRLMLNDAFQSVNESAVTPSFALKD